MFKKDEVFEKKILCVNKSEKEMMIRVSKKEKERMIMLSEKYFEDFEEKYNEIKMKIRKRMVMKRIEKLMNII
jgi:hypothetical protein